MIWRNWFSVIGFCFWYSQKNMHLQLKGVTSVVIIDNIIYYLNKKNYTFFDTDKIKDNYCKYYLDNQ